MHLTCSFQTFSSSMSKASGIIIILIAVCVLCVTLLFLQRSKYAAIADHQQAEIQGILEQLDETARTRSGYLVNEVIALIRSDLEASPDRSIDRSTISFMANASLSFEPMQIALGDSSTNTSLSPERGQLFAYLIASDISTASLGEVWKNVGFEYADLRGITIDSIVIERARLKGASLAGATLTHVNLSKSDLSEADLNGAVLHSVKCTGCKMTRASLRWTQFDQCDLTKSTLSGADLSSADMSNSILQSVTARNCTFDGALMIKADASDADFFISSMANINLTDAILSKADLRHVNLSDAVILRTDLTGSNVDNLILNDAGWLDRLDQFEIAGRDSIQLNYTLGDYMGNAHSHVPYVLRKNKR